MKTVLITGTSRGIGQATAKKFLAEGWRVIGTSQSSDVTSDSHFLTHVLDLTSPESIRDLVASLKEERIRFDAVINNAGVLRDRDEPTLQINKLRQTLEVNVIGLADLTEQIIPLLNSGAHIINISSTLGSFYDGASDWIVPAYRISKAALNMYTITLAERLKASDILVSSLHPGWVKTDMGGSDAIRTPEEAAEDVYQLAIRNVPTGKFWSKGKELRW